MKTSFVTLITSDDYLPGILVLLHSLRQHCSGKSAHVLVTKTVSKHIITAVRKVADRVTMVPPIANPTDVHHKHRWATTYSKIHVFGLVEYDKVVFIDCDALVLRNITDLFDLDPLSGVNAGGLLPQNKNWTDLNTGLFVANPSRDIYNDMLRHIGKLELLTSGGTQSRPKYGSDQDFINRYFDGWQYKLHLHIDHGFNMLHYFLDEYNQHFGYSFEHGPRQISVLHFASSKKPWNFNEIHQDRSWPSLDKALENRAVQHWRSVYKEINST
jgi:glycogenin glucosyltransferase